MINYILNCPSVKQYKPLQDTPAFDGKINVGEQKYNQ